MITPADVDARARTATLRRVGRNLVNVQRIETLLKFLLKLNFDGPMRELEAAFKDHVHKVSRKTLGVLIPEVSDGVLTNRDPAVSPRATTEVWITNSVKVPMNAEDRVAWINPSHSRRQ